jgi:hypothetical protein
MSASGILAASPTTSEPAASSEGNLVVLLITWVRMPAFLALRNDKELVDHPGSLQSLIPNRSNHESLIPIPNRYR